MPLNPIKVLPPVSACSTKVRTECQLTGALVRVRAGTEVIAEGTAKSASDLFDLLPGVTLQAGLELTATQSLDGETSPPSPEPIPVQAAPPELGVLAVGEVFRCGECVYTLGALPGAMVRVTSGGGQSAQLRGESDLAAITNQVDIAPGAANGETLRVIQEASACGLSGDAVPVDVLSTPPALLPPPRLDPLKECQTVIRFSEVFPGATVTLARASGEISGCVAGTGGNWGIAALEPGEELRIRQSFPRCDVLGPFSDPQVVAPIEPIAAPVFTGGSFNGCVGTRSVILRELIPTARFRILVDGEIKGEGEVPNYLTVVEIPVESLADGVILTAQQGLCGIWGPPSDPMLVGGSIPQDIPPPVIPGPLFPCAAAVRVETYVGTVRVTVHSEILGAPIGQAVGWTTAGFADVPVAPLLLPGDTIRASIKDCGPGEIFSDIATVAANSAAAEPPAINPDPPLQDEMTWIPVIDVIPGARVDALVNGEWRGGGTIGGSTGIVPILGSLGLNDVVLVRQRICARTSQDSAPAVVQHKLPVAAFTASPQSGQAPLEVSFTNHSSNANHPSEPYRWTFGDGDPTVLAENPDHTFATAGTFEVTLEAMNASGALHTATASIAVSPDPVDNDDDDDDSGDPDEPEEEEIVVWLENLGVFQGPIPYLGYSSPMPETIMSRIENNSTFFLHFIKVGHSREECDDPDAVVVLPPGGEFGPDEFEEIWDEAQPPGANPHPNGIGLIGLSYNACVGATSSTPPTMVPIRVYFRPAP